MGPADWGRIPREGPARAARGVRIVQVSDTHLSHQRGVTTANFLRVASFVDELLRPDLVVHTGDVVAVSPDEDDRRAAAGLLGRMQAPLRVLPGNHDVGEPGGDPWMGLGITRAHLAAHQATFGPDRFVVQLGAWTVVGCNSELFGSKLPEEDDQWSFLADTLLAAGGRPVLLFLHKPLFAPRPNGHEPARAVMGLARERLLGLPGAEAIRAVGCGHLHRYRRRIRPELLEVWAPSTGFRGKAQPEETHFEQLGVVEWRLGDEGRVDAWFRAPADLDEREADEVPEVTERVARLEAAPADDPGAPSTPRPDTA